MSTTGQNSEALQKLENLIHKVEIKKQEIFSLAKKIRESGNETSIALLDNLDSLKKIEKQYKNQ